MTKIKCQPYKPSNPAFSSILVGYHIMGMFATGSKALGVEEVRSVIRDPLPAARITACNSITLQSSKQTSAVLEI